MLTRLARRALPRAVATTSATPQCFTQTAHKSTQVVDTGRTYDTLYEDVQIGKDAKAQRAFTYVTLGGARFLYASAGRLAVMKFVATMSASADVLALSSLEVDVNKIDPGTTMTVKWRGKPVFIRNRNEAEIASAMECDTTTLRDIESDEERRKEDPTWLVVLGVCTHLGCVPLSNAGDYGGWFCPCHGSHYDTSGRIRKGPAPLNLEVPEWTFMDASLLKLG